jgi:excisionase family DNA binding protein
MMTLHEVAEYLNCHYGTIYRLVRAGDFLAFRLGGSWRVLRSEIEKWIQGGGRQSVRKGLLESPTAGDVVSVRLSRWGPQNENTEVAG